MHFKSLMNNFNVMNAALLAMLVLVAGYEFPSFFHVQSKYVLPAPAKSVGTEDKTVDAQPASPSEYSVIAEQNVFHPERIIPVLKPAAAPLPVPEFVLYGTLIAGDVSLAYMEDLKGTGNSAGARRQKSLKKGETISGFTLKEIETDKVVMVRGEEKLEVRVTDKARTKHADSAPTTTQGAPASAASAKKPALRRTRPDTQSSQPTDTASAMRRHVRRPRNVDPNVQNSSNVAPQ